MMFKEKICLLLIFGLIAHSGCDIFNNCEEFESRQVGFYKINIETGKSEFFPLPNHDSFIAEANLMLTDDGNIWASSVYKNQVIDPHTGKLLRSIHKDQPVLTLPSSKALFYAQITHSWFNYDENLSAPSLADSSFILSVDKESGAIDTLFWHVREFIEPDKLVLRKLYLPIESYVEGKKGLFAILDEETKILTTDSLKTVLTVNQFHFERNYVFIEEGTNRIEKVVPMGNELEQHIAFESPTISEIGGVIAFEIPYQKVIVIKPSTGELLEFEGSNPVLSRDGKYLALSNEYSPVRVFDIEENEEIEIGEIYLSSWDNTPNFSLQSDRLLVAKLFNEGNLEYGAVWEQAIGMQEEYYNEIVDTRELITEKELDLMRSTISQVVQLNDHEFFFFYKFNAVRWCE